MVVYGIFYGDMCPLRMNMTNQIKPIRFNVHIQSKLL